MVNTAVYVSKLEMTIGKPQKRLLIQKQKSIANGLKRRAKMRLIDLDKIDVFNQEPSEVVFDVIHAEPVDAMPLSFITDITQRDICLVYRGCLLMLLEKWRL